jgi:hypothetical protein
MSKVKRRYYLTLASYYAILVITIGGFPYLPYHWSHHKEYHSYFYYYIIAGIVLFVSLLVVRMGIQATKYCFPQEYAAEQEKLRNKVNQELVWTKEMIDYMRMSSDVIDFSNTFPIRINIQEHSDDSSISDIGKEPRYFGQTRYDKMDYYEEDGTINVDAYEIKETYELLAQVDVWITFFDPKNPEDEELTKQLRSEEYKYGYMAFWNPKKNEIIKLVTGSDSKPVAIICLNKECGIKEKIDDLFVKSKIFNYKSLNITIEYNGKSMESLEYEKFCDKENRVPIKDIRLDERFTLS